MLYAQKISTAFTDGADLLMYKIDYWNLLPT